MRCTVAEAEMQSVRQLEQKDVEMASVKQQLDDAERQHNVQLTRLQIEVTTSHSVYSTCLLPRDAHVTSIVSRSVLLLRCVERGKDEEVAEAAVGGSSARQSADGYQPGDLPQGQPYSLE